MFCIKNKFLLTILTLTFFAVGTHTNTAAQPGKYYLDPPVTCTSILDTFFIDISVDSNLTGIHCFRVNIDFERDWIELDSVMEGPLLRNQGTTFFYWKDTSGVYDIFNCIYDPPDGYADGPGVLATLRFVAGGQVGIPLVYFTYAVFQDTALQPIEHNYDNGFVIICGPEGCHFGDANYDNKIDVGDVVYIINYLFKNGPEPVPVLLIGDTNCDFNVDVGDVVYLINYLFRYGPEPCSPCGS